MNNTIKVADYKITGLVDIRDEQGNLNGQFEIGSVQELPVDYGTMCVNNGVAELVEGSEKDVEVENTNGPADVADGAAGAEVGADLAKEGGDTTVETEQSGSDATGETGEEQVQ